MDVSIILCTYNRDEHLKETLRSLQQAEVPEEWAVELLLVDNISTDATPEVIRAFEHPEMEVRVVREEKRGCSYARNRGVSEASGEVLLFTDDDVRVPPDWVEEMATPILEGGGDAVAGGVELAEEVRADWMSPVHRSLLASTEEIDPEQPDRMVGANMAIAAGVFEEIPRFDPELGPGALGLGGETLVSLQILEAGFRIESAFDVTVEHHADPSRLTWEKWDEAAEKSGRAGAYLSYHWKQRQYSLPTLAAGWLYCTLRVWWKRVAAGFGRPSNGGMPTDELYLRRKKYRIRQHLRQYGRERKHNKID